MKIELIAATKEDQIAIQNLDRFYGYDMSRYCGFLPGWETPPDGLYRCRDFSCYWEEPDRYSFLIKVGQELAGFVLVNKLGLVLPADLIY